MRELIERKPIETAPRNGLTIIVGDDDVGSFAMHWNPHGTNALVQPDKLGIWETADRAMTWSDADGCGPSWWHPLPTQSEQQNPEGREERSA